MGITDINFAKAAAVNSVLLL